MTKRPASWTMPLPTVVIKRSRNAFEASRAQLRVVAGPDRGRELEFTAETVVVGRDRGARLVLSDLAVSDRHFEISVDDRCYLLKDLGSTNGVLLDGYRVREAFLPSSATITVGQSELSFRIDSGREQVLLHPDDRLGGLIGPSEPMRRMFRVLDQLSANEIPVLLQGETGTGKEVAARVLHERSPRSDRPFVAVNCAAIQPTLVESELFGHVRGAFSGAVSAKHGLVATAEGGTLLLDEIADIPLESQAKLLRTLEDKQVRPVGGTRSILVDVRFVAATKRNLRAEADAGRFRDDLYYRLAGVEIWMPPLRERAADVLPLAEHFVRELGADPADILSEEVRRLLRSHDWPGNVRELRRMTERMVALPHQPTEFYLHGSVGGAPPPRRPLFNLPYREAVNAFRRQYLTQCLERAGGNIKKAAADVGVPESTFRRHLEQRLGSSREVDD